MKHISILVSAMLLTGCSGIRHEGREERAISQLTMTSENYVDTMHLHKGDFLRQMICNGKLRAMVKSELKSRHMDVLTSINVSNGTRVPKGALLAVTDETLYKRELEKAQRELEKARIDLADKLITMGYDSDGRGVPQDVMRRAEVTSGYYSAQYALETAETSLRDCYLTAPVSGVIANLEGHLHQLITDQFCTIIDDSCFDVEFSVLEAELYMIQKGMSVSVSPFSDESYVVAGRITNINPTVEENGLVKVQAQIPGGSSHIMDGMNVRVVCQQTIPDMYVVPKDAVVERDGYYVIFVLTGGRARWTYVDILHSNITHHAITGCKRKGTEIHEGDIVITSGNLNLADDIEVAVK